MSQPILAAKHIKKVYPNGVIANYDVDFSVNEGEIHAIIGENGAGKSTLMKILFGAEQPDEGVIELYGKKTIIDSPQYAINHGIGMVYQHFMLVPSLSVSENIMLGYEPKKKGILYDREKVRTIVEEYAKRAGFDIDPDILISDLNIGMRQKVEILKVLVRGARILILGEPTAVLTPQETRELFEQLSGLKRQGHTIIFISHKLNEIMQLCDRVTIMVHGRTEGVYSTKDITPDEISRKMVGRDVVLQFNKNKICPGKVLLEAQGICYKNTLGKTILNDVSLKIREGEIIGVAGVEGNGQNELARILSGNIKPAEGAVKIGDQSATIFSPIRFRDQGICYIPEDRMETGSAPALSIYENLFSTIISRARGMSSVVLKRNIMKKYASNQIQDFQILCGNESQPVGMLSGGNIQKVVAAREMTGDVKVLIAEQPTRGIDVGASEIIRNKIIELRDQGKGILLISADLNEILEISDKIIVMHNGWISGYFEDAAAVTEEELGLYMLGLKSQLRRIEDEHKKI